jgi:hypothetical protein
VDLTFIPNVTSTFLNFYHFSENCPLSCTHTDMCTSACMSAHVKLSNWQVGNQTSIKVIFRCCKPTQSKTEAWTYDNDMGSFPRKYRRARIGTMSKIWKQKHNNLELHTDNRAPNKSLHIFKLLMVPILVISMRHK